MIHEHRFDSREQMLDQLYRVVISSLQRDLDKRRSASLLLSGGSTPGPLYERLSQAELDWSHVFVALVDERWVDADHQASNERLLKQTLLQGPASACDFTAMKNTAASPFDGEDSCNTDYSDIPRPYSLTLLGMGGDGHTASLFPHAQGLQAALESTQCCAAIEARRSSVTGDYLQRMTLTPWAILQSQKVILLITGADKWAVYQQARLQENVLETPVSLFLQQDQVDVDVYWAP